MRATQVIKCSGVKHFGQIAPEDVVLLNQIDLPFALVLLKTRLAHNRGVNIFKCLGINEHLHAVFLRESLDETLAMLPDATRKVVRYADVERAVAFAG